MKWTKTQTQALEAAFAALDDVGIDWLVLRNHRGLPHANRSKDVDLGLDKKQFRIAEQTISEALRGAGFDRILVDDFQYVRCLTFFSTSMPDPQSLKIDLLDGFVFRGAQVFHFRQLFEDAQHDGGFAIPSATDDAVMLWLKPLITGGIVKSKYLSDINRAALNDPSGFRAILERILTLDWAGRAWSKIEAGDIKATIAMQAGLRKSVWQRAFRRAPFATLRDAMHHVISELLRRSRRPTATFLAVLGPDGSGKTTFITALRERLATLQIKDLEGVEVTHFRPHLLPNINQLLTGKPEVISESNNPHSAPPAGKVSSFLRIGYYSLDYILGYWLKIRRSSIRGRTMIFDRYFYDFTVDPQRSRLSLPLWVVKIFLFFIPKPDLIIVLDATSSVIYARKQELQPEEIDRQLTAYRKLADDDPIRFLRLDSAQSPEAMVDVATHEVITRLYPEI
jgi:thymidylate kinase